MHFDFTGNRACGFKPILFGKSFAIFGICFVLMLPATLTFAQPTSSPAIDGPGLGSHRSEFEIAAPPMNPGNLDALADALRKIADHIGSASQTTLSHWESAAQAAGIRVIYLGRCNPARVELPGLANFAAHSADATDNREAANQVQMAARRRGFDLRAFAATIVFADANLVYAVSSDADWPIAVALAGGSMESLEDGWKRASSHPLRAVIKAQLRAAVVRRLRAAREAGSVSKLYNRWKPFADVEMLDRKHWLGFRETFAEGDFAAVGEFADGGSADSPAIAFAAQIAARHAAITKPDALPTADADLAADLAWWRQHAPQADRIDMREPLPVAYWRLAPYAGATTAPRLAPRLAQQVHEFGNGSAMRAIFDGIATEHLAVLLATAKWQSTHADALAWLAERIGESAERDALLQIERDALAAAVAPMLKENSELRAVIIDRLIRPLALVESVAELKEAALAGDVAAVRALTEIAADVAAESGVADVAAERGVAGPALKKLVGLEAESASAELVVALCRLALAGLDESAVAAMVAIVRNARFSPQIRSMALENIFAIAPAEALAVVEEWAANPPGAWVQPLIARLRNASLPTPSTPFKAPAAPSAVAIVGAANLPTPALAALESALRTAGLAPYRLPDSASAAAQSFARRIEIFAPSSTGQGGSHSLPFSNLPMPWRAPIRLTGQTERESCNADLLPSSFVLVRAIDPWPTAFPGAAEKLAQFAARLAALPIPPEAQPDPSAPEFNPESNPEPLPVPPTLPTPLPIAEREISGASAVSLRLHASFATAQFTEFAPSPELQNSFAQSTLLAFKFEFDWRDALPKPFGLQATAGLGVLLVGQEIWRDQTNDLSALIIAANLGAFAEPIAAHEPADWALRIGLSPGLKLFSIARTNVVTNGSPQADESITRTYFAVRIDAQIWNERAFDASVPIGLIAAGEVRLYIGPGSGFGYEWFAGLTWTPEPAFSLVLAVTNRYEELFAEADRKFASNGFGARLAFALWF